jgi:hypothetical protein
MPAFLPSPAGASYAGEGECINIPPLRRNVGSLSGKAR